MNEKQKKTDFEKFLSDHLRPYTKEDIYRPYAKHQILEKYVKAEAKIIILGKLETEKKEKLRAFVPILTDANALRAVFVQFENDTSALRARICFNEKENPFIELSTIDKKTWATLSSEIISLSDEISDRVKTLYNLEKISSIETKKTVESMALHIFKSVDPKPSLIEMLNDNRELVSQEIEVQRLSADEIAEKTENFVNEVSRWIGSVTKEDEKRYYSIFSEALNDVKKTINPGGNDERENILNRLFLKKSKRDRHIDFLINVLQDISVNLLGCYSDFLRRNRKNEEINEIMFWKLFDKIRKKIFEIMEKWNIVKSGSDKMMEELEAETEAETFDPFEKVKALNEYSKIEDEITRIESFSISNCYTQDVTRATDIFKGNDEINEKDIQVFIDYSDLENIEGLTLSKDLNPVDKNILDSANSLANVNKMAFTDKMIAKIFFHGNSQAKPSKKQLETVQESLKKISTARVRIEYKQGDKTIIIEDYLLPIRVTTITDGKNTVVGYEIISEPPLLRLAKETKKINSIPMNLLNVKTIQATTENAIIRNYILQRIGQLKYFKKNKNGVGQSIILIDSIFENAGLTFENTSAGRTKRERKVNTIYAILDHYKAVGHIKDYVKIKEKGRHKSVKIIV